ncbi:MAG: hypothetical protein HN337_05660 [Deltaproteobacteria bacterium]|jgi:hypothetical protein|nr:hypothetical protein [Deltaproteobacteria bacterium]
MKKTLSIAIYSLLLTGIAITLSCGMPYTHSTTQEEIENAAKNFSYIVDGCLEGSASIAKEETKLCDCPEGGRIDENSETGTLTVSSCVSEDNLTFNGTFTRNEDNTIDMDMSEFGNCVDVSGTDVGIDPDTGCSGEFTMTCIEIGQTCVYSDPAEGADRCDVTCTPHTT